MLAVLSSVTTASRMKRYLEQKGILVRMIETPKAIAKGGCGYSLVIPHDQEEEVKKAARTMQSRVRGFYREEGSGADKRYIPLS